MAAVFMKRNISLIGMPACGKSTIGVLLAKTLNMQFIDTDLLLQQEHGKFLWEIIASEGLDEFKRKEAGIVCSLRCENTCIATGGSVVYSEEAMNHLKQISTVVFLDLSPQEVEGRISDIKSRGVVIEEGKTIAQLYHERKPLYVKYADIVLPTDNKSIEELLVLIKSQVHCTK